SLDRVHLGLLHLLEELPGVRRQRLHVTPLTLGIDGVGGERRFAGAREPGDHDELIARDLEIDVLEIVLAGPSDDDPIVSHGASLYGAPRAVGAPATWRQRREAKPSHALVAPHAGGAAASAAHATTRNTRMIGRVSSARGPVVSDSRSRRRRSARPRTSRSARAVAANRTRSTPAPSAPSAWPIGPGTIAAGRSKVAASAGTP